MKKRSSSLFYIFDFFYFESFDFYFEASVYLSGEEYQLDGIYDPVGLAETNEISGLSKSCGGVLCVHPTG